MAQIRGSQYTLTVRKTSDARLEDVYGSKPSKLEYLSSAALAPPETKSTTQPPAQARSVPGTTLVHVTSAPSGGEIYIDGKFFGNTPSDVTLSAGEHVFKITIGGREWSRTVQITAGEIRVHADIAEK